MAAPIRPKTQACWRKLSVGTRAMPAQARVRPLTVDPSRNMRCQTGCAWRLGIAESKAATWITRNATRANSQTIHTLSNK